MKKLLMFVLCFLTTLTTLTFAEPLPTQSPTPLPKQVRILSIVLDATIGDSPGTLYTNELSINQVKQKMATVSEYYWTASARAIDIQSSPHSHIIKLSGGTIHGGGTNICDDYGAYVSSLAGQVDQTLASQGLNRSDFDFEQYVLPQSTNFLCAESGIADPGSIANNNKGRWSVLFSHDPLIWVHEMGHNFGLFHAGADNNGDGLSEGAYSDASSVMGSPNKLVNFNGADHASLGWLEQQLPGSIQQISASGVYTIHALSAELPFKGHQRVLRFEKFNHPDSVVNLYLSYRQLSGLDSELNPTYTQGLQVHQGSQAKHGEINANPTVLYRHFDDNQNSYQVDLLSTVSTSGFDFEPYLTHTGFTIITLEQTAEHLTFHLLFDDEQSVLKPYITRQPGPNFSVPGYDTYFNFEVYSPTPATYQWYYQSSLNDEKQRIEGATDTALPLNNVSVQDVGFYSVEVTNESGTTSSIASYLDVFLPPTLLSQPQDQLVSLNAPMILRLNSPQSPQGIVKWYRNGSLMHQAYTPAVTFAAVTDFHAGTWHAEITNGVGSIITNTFEVVVQSPLTILNEAQLLLEHTAVMGKPFALTVDATGATAATALTYQWFKNGVVMPAQTTNTLTFASTNYFDGAIYSVAVTNGSFSKSVHGIIVQTAYGLTYNGPQNQQLTLYSNMPLYLAFTVSGSPTAWYQWFKDGQSIGTNSSVYLVPMVSTADAGVYEVRIFNGVEDFTVTVATVSVVQW